LPNAPDGSTSDDEELVDELELLVEDSVRRQLVADVPVGILLSGGVDSSLVTAMAARASSRVKNLTVGFNGYGNYDETGYARLIASHFGTEHIELQAGTTGPDILNELARQYDEPLNDSSMIPTFLVSQLVRQHCKVALGGDGGDEMFGGYEQHRRLLWMKSKIDHVPLGLRRIAAAAGDMALPIGFRGRSWIQALAVDFNTRLPSVAAHFDASERRALMGPTGKHPPTRYEKCAFRSRRIFCSASHAWISRTTYAGRYSGESRSCQHAGFARNEGPAARLPDCRISRLAKSQPD